MTIIQRAGLVACLFLGLAAAGSAAPAWQAFDWAGASAARGSETLDGVWAGIFVEKSPGDNPKVSTLEANLKRRFAVEMWFADYSTEFPTQAAESAWASGRVPNITWEPWLWSDQNKIHLADINAGTYDAYITKWGQDAAAWGRPVFVRWGHEFNGNWYPWAMANNGNSPETYVQAYRRVHDLVSAAGAANVIWVWCPNAASVPASAWNNPVAAYPGDSYVDWVALDGYDFDGNASFADLFSRIYTEVLKVSIRPLYIGETATGRTGSSKAAWIKGMHEALTAKFPGIKGLVWFDIKKERDWRLEESKASLEGATAVFSQPFYHGRPDAVVTLATAFTKNLQAYRTQGQKLTSVARNQVSLPAAVVGTSGTLDWTRATSLDVLGPQGAFGTLQLAWDTANLYLRLESRSGVGMKNAQSQDLIWNGDGLEFCLSTNPQADPNRGYFTPTDWQLGFSPGDGTPAHGPRSWEWTKLKAEVPGASVTSRATSSGYVLEVTVPWKAFGSFQPTVGVSLGFDAAVDQSGPDGTRGYQWVWNGNNQFYNSPVQWGTLVLAGPLQ